MASKTQHSKRKRGAKKIKIAKKRIKRVKRKLRKAKKAGVLNA